jgi:hypothetical protein
VSRPSAATSEFAPRPRPGTALAYGDQVRSYLPVIEGLLYEPDPAARRRRAVLTLSALCG